MCLIFAIHPRGEDNCTGDKIEPADSTVCIGDSKQCPVREDADEAEQEYHRADNLKPEHGVSACPESNGKQDYPENDADAVEHRISSKQRPGADKRITHESKKTKEHYNDSEYDSESFCHISR